MDISFKVLEVFENANLIDYHDFTITFFVLFFAMIFFIFYLFAFEENRYWEACK